MQWANFGWNTATFFDCFCPLADFLFFFFVQTWIEETLWPTELNMSFFFLLYQYYQSIPNFWKKNNFLLFSLVFLPFFLFLLSNNKLFVFNDKRFGLGLSTKLRVPTLYFTRATNNIKLQSNWHRLCQWEAGTVAWPLPGLTLLNLLLIVIAS